MSSTPVDFSAVLLRWQAQHGRHTLPWQVEGNPYFTWLSEVMLQQTQVATVLAYFQRFVQAFPTVQHLAAASDESVMQLWQGLGYYSRARNLHRCAQQVVAAHGGEFPREVALLEALPGIGRSTAGAIASLAHGQCAPILDGNVKRVFCRHFGVEGHPEQTGIKKQLWLLAEQLMPKQEPGRYNQALMDLGATVCTPKGPRCGQCPVQGTCVALRRGVVHQLPTPKPKKSRPQLYFVALVLRDEQGRWCLQPPSDAGLWRGLWTPPLVQIEPSETAHLQHVSQALAEQWPSLHAQTSTVDFTQVVNPQTQWMVHELTHRQLHFKPVVVDVPCQSNEWIGLEFHAVQHKPVPRWVHKLSDLVQGSVPNQQVIDFR